MAGTARILVVMGRLNRGAAPASHSLPRHPAHDQPYDTYTSPTIAGEHPRPVYRIASYTSRSLPLLQDVDSLSARLRGTATLSIYQTGASPVGALPSEPFL
jgi:hypothetical protein